MEPPENAQEPESSSPENPQDEDRREFLTKAACIALGGCATLVPAASAITVFVSPLFEESEGGLLVRLISIDSLEVGAAPQLFKVVTERQDAWTKHTSSEIGSVFVERKGTGETPEDFLVFTSTCPHLGCAVEFLSEADSYSCPCHDSTFSKTGEILNQTSPSPRGLDSLRVEVREGDLYVDYQRFKANVTEKVPTA